MTRLFRFIVLVGVFVGGYYLGRTPNSPDLFAYAQGLYQAASRSSDEIAAKARDEQVSIPKAAMSYVTQAACKSAGNQIGQILPGSAAHPEKPIEATEYK